MKQFDSIIIGFGKAGKTLAPELAEHGQKVAMIEQSDKMYGGTCPNIGCIPTKFLVHQAKLASLHQDLPFDEKKKVYREVIDRKEQLTAMLREKNYHKLADHENITVYTGKGSFVASDTVQVETAEGNFELQAKQIFINTGAETVIPPIDGLRDNSRVYTSKTLMELSELPRRLVIVGGGYIGLEFASIYASFGSEVLVLEGFSELIPREDRDIAAAVKEILEKKGIRFQMNAKVTAIRTENDQAIVHYENTLDGQSATYAAEAVLIATGRRPNSHNLNLEAAGVRTDERGAIVVDAHLKTSNAAIRAMGDVKGGLQFTYISLDDARIIREDLWGDHERNIKDREPVSYSVFIDPPLSRIGLSEEEAKQKNLEVRVNKLAVAALPRARTLGETEGWLKAIIDRQTDRILGCTLLCPESSEIINTVALAMKHGLKAKDLRDFIFTHPSMSEALNDLFA